MMRKYDLALMILLIILFFILVYQVEWTITETPLTGAFFYVPGGTCFDGIQNQDESDVDCGGICGATCADGKRCNLDSDCISGVCEGTYKIQLQETFDNLSGWTVVDEGSTNAPSNWYVSGGVYIQDSNIYGGTRDAEAYGTYSYKGAVWWRDYIFKLRIKSIDDDSIGVMFRYKDNGTYYRLRSDLTLNQTLLEKFVNGNRTLITSVSGAYTQGQWHDWEIRVNGSHILFYFDGNLTFNITDSSIDAGKIALYCWANQNSYFDNITVNVYTSVCVSCNDGIQNQGEFYIDCGGPCPPCDYVPLYYDDCGNPANDSHRVQGSDFEWTDGINPNSTKSEKTISYHNVKLIYKYSNLTPLKNYLVKVTYLQPSGDNRTQKLLADDYELHGAMQIPTYDAQKFEYKIPPSAVKDGEFYLYFIPMSGPNAVCSEIELWASPNISYYTHKWTFDEPSDYIYNTSEIEISNSSAKLLPITLELKENLTYYDFNPVASDLSYGAYNLKTVFHLSRVYDYYNFSIELKRTGNASGVFQIAVNDPSNIVNVTNASQVDTSYTVYTARIPSAFITNKTVEIWTLTKSNISFRIDGTPSNNSYFRSANDSLGNTGWTKDNNDYYHMLLAYDLKGANYSILETKDFEVAQLDFWYNLTVSDTKGFHKNLSNESYDYASNQTGATAQASSGAEHLIDEDETISGGDYYAWCYWPCNLSVTFNKSAYINKIYIHLWDGDARFYNYSLWISADGVTWKKVVDNKYAHGPQNDTFSPTLTKHIKIEGLRNTANAGFHVIEVDAFEAMPKGLVKYYYSTDSGITWQELPANYSLLQANTSSKKIRFRANISQGGEIYDMTLAYKGAAIGPSCSDGIKNQDETDVDCGGSCPPCAIGKHCLTNSDCISDLCINGVCVEKPKAEVGVGAGPAKPGVAAPAPTPAIPKAPPTPKPKPKIRFLGDFEKQESFTLQIKPRENWTFTFKGANHTIKIEQLTNNSIVLLIESEPIKIELQINESAQVDLDRDGVNDLKITLQTIKDNHAILKLETIKPPVKKIMPIVITIDTILIISSLLLFFIYLLTRKEKR